MEAWNAVAALGSVAAAAVAAWAARQSRQSATEANRAATRMTRIEEQRRHSELCPQFELTAKGSQTTDLVDVTLQVKLLGPIGLDRLDKLTVTIRDDYFRRHEGSNLAAGPTPEEVNRQVWGPYRLKVGVGPDEARPDPVGKSITYDSPIPIGEGIPLVLEPTPFPPWAPSMRKDSWRQLVGEHIRITLHAEQDDHGVCNSWSLPCEIQAPMSGQQLPPIRVPPAQCPSCAGVPGYQVASVDPRTG